GGEGELVQCEFRIANCELRSVSHIFFQIRNSKSAIRNGLRLLDHSLTFCTMWALCSLISRGFRTHSRLSWDRVHHAYGGDEAFFGQTRRSGREMAARG